MTNEDQPQSDERSDEQLKWPIGFIVMVTLAALYLIVRLIQMAGWAIDGLF